MLIAGMVIFFGALGPATLVAFLVDQAGEYLDDERPVRGYAFYAVAAMLAAPVALLAMAGVGLFIAWTVHAIPPSMLIGAGIMALAACRKDELDRRRRFRLCHDLCLECGYDLRATPLRCPECGRSTKTPSPDCETMGGRALFQNIAFIGRD